MFPATVLTDRLNSPNCFDIIVTLGCQMMTTPLSSFLHSPANFTVGAVAGLRYIPDPIDVSRFFLARFFFLFPLPGAFVAPVGLAGTPAGFWGGVAAFLIGSFQSIVSLIKDIIFYFLCYEDFIDLL